MRAKCISSTLSKEQERDLGADVLSQDFHLIPGREYLVFGLQFRFGGEGGTGVWVEYETELGYLSAAPIALFEISDPSVSKLWQLTVSAGTAFLEPPSFKRDYYFDDLSSGIDEVRKDFAEVKRMISSE